MYLGRESGTVGGILSSLNILGSGGLHICHINIRSLFRDEIMDQLRLLLLPQHIDCLTVSETWLSDKVPDNQIHIDGYNIVRLDRAIDKKCGGLLAYVRSDTTISLELTERFSVSNEDLEMHLIRIKKGVNKKLTVVNIYRPPSGKVNEALDLMHDKLTELLNYYQNAEIIMLGDFNIDMKIENNDTRNLRRNTASLGLTQLITEYTRYNPDPEGKHSMIDLIFTNSPQVKESGVLSPALSDHEMIYMTRKHTPITKTKLSFKGRSYFNYNKENFVTGLKNSNWDRFWESNDAEEAWNIFTDQISYLLDFTCPIKEFNFKQKMAPWLDRNLISLIKDKNAARAKYRKTQNIDDLNISNYLINLTKEACLEAKKGFYENEYDTNTRDPKRYWKAINSLINPKPTNISFTLVDHENAQAPIAKEETANFINSFFANIGAKLARNMDQPWSYSGPDVQSQFNFNECTIEDIIPILKKININKSSGVTHVSTKALKDALLTLPLHMTHMVNLVINTQTFPDSWKKAQVKPLPKGGDTTNVSNLRPISILPLPAKLTEKVIHRQIIDYLNINDLLNENQDGFRPKRSTMDSLTKFTNNIYKGFNKQHCTTAIFLDFKKAFDTLDHTILAKKLDKVGFDHSAVALIADYLSNRQQTTKANDIVSDPMTITCGVPQGSVLGPLLFLIYINDMNTCLSSLKCQHYADDTVIYIEHTPANIEIAHTINQDLNKISTWCITNKLSLNTTKTKAMTFTTKALAKTLIRPPLTIGNDNIHYAPTYPYLGLTLDNMLNYKKHVNILERNLEHKTFILRKARKNMTEEVAIKVLKNMIIPIADYGDICYKISTKTHQNKIQLVINKALRTCIKDRGTINTEKLMKVADINYLSDRREQHQLQLAFNMSQDNRAIDRRNIRTRAHDERLLKVTRPKNPAYRHSVEYRLATTWNSLDTSIRSFTTKTQFKQWNDNIFKEKRNKLPNI